MSPGEEMVVTPIYTLGTPGYATITRNLRCEIPNVRAHGGRIAYGMSIVLTDEALNFERYRRPAHACTCVAGSQYRESADKYLSKQTGTQNEPPAPRKPELRKYKSEL